MKVAQKLIAGMLALIIAASQPATVLAAPKDDRGSKSKEMEMQLQGHKQFNNETLEGKWSQYSADKDFKTLVDKAKKDGFERIGKDRTAWGFEASDTRWKDAAGKAVPAEVCAFDFMKKTPDGVQMASLVWKHVGDDFYKALVVFPKGETDPEKALNGMVEYTVDANGDIQLAHSFATCWKSCLLASAGFCVAATGACAGLAAAIGLSGVGVPVAIGILASCAGAFCLIPMAVCAVRC